MNIDINKRIVCAAMRHENGLVICSPRHFDSCAHAQISATNLAAWHLAEQGFVNTWGEFLDRKDAWMVASHNNQIIRLVGSQSGIDIGMYGTKLFSENLY